MVVGYKPSFKGGVGMSRGQSLIGVALLWACGAVAVQAAAEESRLTESSQRVRATFARGAFQLTLECDTGASPLVLARATDGVWSLTRWTEVLKGSSAIALADQLRAKVEDRTDLKACVAGARQDAVESLLALSSRVLISFDSALSGERIVARLAVAPTEFGGGRAFCGECLARADEVYSDCSGQPVLQDVESQSKCGGVYGALLDSCHQYCPPPAAEQP
jgi:hypothetical protein